MATLGLLIDVLGPVVLIVSAGAIAARRLGLETKTLSKLAFWVLGPTFVFDVFATASVSAATTFKLITTSVIAAVASMFAAAVFVRFTNLSPTKRDAAVSTASYGNVGNAGLAICAFAFGEQALASAGVVMLTVMFFGTFVCVWYGIKRHATPMAAITRTIRSPMIMAAFVGLAVNVAEIPIPLVLGRTMGTISKALIPIMLLTLGIQLASIPKISFRVSTLVISAAKLIISPLVAAAVGIALGLSGENLGVAIVQGAMPPAVFCMIMAIEHDLEPDQVTNDVVLNTFLALATLPVAVILTN